MSIKLRNIVIDYGNSIAVNDLSLSIETGELISLLGPSGCGKSTTLNAIAGLIQVTKGQILFDGVDMTKKAPQKRNIGLVFQNYALYPHLNVFKNIAFPLYQNNSFKKEIRKNNKLVRWRLDNLRQSGTYQKDIKFQQNLELAIKKSVKSLVHEFDKIASVNLKKIQKIADKYAVDIYGDTELNALRSRQFSMWFDASRAFIEEQKLDFYQKVINQFLQTFNNLKVQLSKHQKCIKQIEFVFIQETKYLKIEDLPRTKNKAQAITSTVKVHKNLLKSESKSAIRLAKIAGEELKWNVTLEQRELLVNHYQENQQVWAEEFKKLITNLLNEKNLVNNLGIDILDITSAHLQSRSQAQIKKEVFDQQILELHQQIKSFRKEVKKAVFEVANKVEITSQLKKKPYELSGGQQQRVAIARAIVKKPKVLLLDEPLSNLDAKLRATTREWIKKFQKETGITTIFVTHDQEEAMSISDRIFVINQGEIQQGDSPMEIYNHPANQFVANFIGTPSMNFFHGEIDEKGNVISNKVNFGKVKNKEIFDQKVVIGVRPEHIEIVGSNEKFKKANDQHLAAKVDNIERLGRSDYIRAFLPNKQEVRIIYDAKNYDLAEKTKLIEFDVLKEKVFIFANHDQNQLLEVI